MFKDKMSDIEILRKRFVELERVFDSISDLIFILDNTHMITKVNRAFAQALHAKPEDLVGKKCYELLHKLHSPFPGCPMEKTLRDGASHVEEVDDPNIGIPLLVTTSPIFDDKKNLVGIAHVAKDIRAAKAAAERVSEMEIKYKMLYETSKDAMMIVSPEKGFLGGNPSTIEMFRCKDEAEFTSQSPASLSPEYQPDGQLSSLKAQEMMKIALEKGSHFFEWKHKRMNQEEFFVTVLLTRVDIKNENLLYATVHDISARKKAEEALKERVTALERFQKITVDREFRMKELKEKIKELEKKTQL